MRFRDGEEERGAGVRFVPLVTASRDPRVLGRRARDPQPERPTVPGGGPGARRDPGSAKGPPRSGRDRPRRPPSARCARRRALEATPVEKLGDVRYWYARDGERVLKVVSFFLFRYRSGRLEDHDDEVEEALWIPLEEAPERLAYRGEKDMARTAQSQLAKGS